MLALRALAGLKWLRVRGSRYAIEQAMIDKWLAGVVARHRSATGSWATRSRCAGA